MVLLKQGWSMLVPAAIADYDVVPLTSRSRLLDAFIDNRADSLGKRVNKFLHERWR